MGPRAPAVVLAVLVWASGWSGAASAPSPSPSTTPPKTAAPVPVPRLTVPAAILQDLDSGQMLFQKASHQRRPVASLTKMMAAVLVLERLSLDRIVTVGPGAAAQPGTGIGLGVGERVTVRNLLYAMLLVSANDAAVALAEAMAGSEGAFVGMMNRRAEELELDDTFFFSTTGLDDRGYSTAADLAALTREAYGHAPFARIVATRFRSIPAPGGGHRLLQNRNVLLFRYDGAVGAKTGMTTAAGHCLVAVADRGGVRLLAVALGHPTLSFDDGAALLDYGYAAFRLSLLVAAGEPVGVVEIGGAPVQAVAGEDFAWLLRIAPPPVVERSLRPDPEVTIPVPPGAVIGRLTIRVDGHQVATVRALAAPPSPPEPSAAPPGPVVATGASAFGEAVVRARAIVVELVGAFL